MKIENAMIPAAKRIGSIGPEREVRGLALYGPWRALERFHRIVHAHPCEDTVFDP